MTRRTASHIDDPDTLGRRLRQARTGAGLRLVDLAFAGCSVGYLSHLERGRRVPSLQVIRELARRLGVSEGWLAIGSDEPPEGETDALVEAEAALRFDDLDTAERLYRESLEGCTDTRVQSRARGGLGQLAYLRDDPWAAIEELEAAGELDGELRAEAAFVETLGRARAQVGETEVAVGLFRRQLEAARAAADALEEVRFSVLLANALIDLSAFAEASQVLAGVLSKTAGEDPVLLARLYWAQSRLHAMKRETGVAARYARRAIDLLDATEFTQYRSRAHHLLALIEIDAGHPELAIELIERGRELARSGGTALDTARFDLEEARARAALGELDRAAALINRAATELARHDPRDVGRCYAELAAVCARADELDRARELYELALEYLEPGPNRALAETYHGFGGVLERMGDKDAAFEIYKRGSRVSAELERLGG